MAKAKKQAKASSAQRADRVKLTAEESLKRVHEFAKRKEEFVAAVQQGQVVRWLVEVNSHEHADHASRHYAV
jgi:hypothetical protein